jgi:hypothetical protein
MWLGHLAASFGGFGVREGETVGCRDGCNGWADGGLGAPFRAPFWEACTNMHGRHECD